MPNTNLLSVAELFAGVGGFRLGLEGWNGLSPLSRYSTPIEPRFKVIYSNQWEPSTKVQHASDVYEYRWGKEGHSNDDISTVDSEDIPFVDILVGGFPCQDYSVATTLKNSKGIQGKKGVLWWDIHRIISEKSFADRPSYLILENVDRLLNSPVNQKGRDFAIILRCLLDLGYEVEWKVINAADYGMPQRRRRIFIVAYKQDTPIYKRLSEIGLSLRTSQENVLAKAFAATSNTMLPHEFQIDTSLQVVSDDFGVVSKDKFLSDGFCRNDKCYTYKTEPIYSGNRTLLKDVLQETPIDDEFIIDSDDLDKWKIQKGSKKKKRISPDGHEYFYSEGAMLFPDDINKPSRTIITGEGGKSASRFKHVIPFGDKFRRLTPLELERLNMFPDNHTKFGTVSNTKRAFFMGNALVVGVVEKIGDTIWSMHNG